MARSEDPRDNAQMGDLRAELQGFLNRGETLIARAQELAGELEAETTRARADRVGAAEETRKQKAVAGETPRPAPEVKQTTEAIKQELTAQERLNLAKREEFRIQQQIRREQEQIAAEAQRQRRLPVPYGRQITDTGTYGPGTAEERIRASGDAIRRKLADDESAANRAETWDRQRRARELQSTLAAQRYERDRPTPLMLGPGEATQGRPGLPIFEQGPPPIVQTGQNRPGLPSFAGPQVKLDDIAKEDEATAGLTKSQEKLLEQARLTKFSQDELTQSLGYQARVVGISSNAYQKHGYLTSEFIQAAAKGQVTFRELGQQVGGTIAKFAGWTAAAASVYGALGAVSALGKGAIAASNAVQLLNRVIDQTKRTDAGGNRISDQDIQTRLGDLAGKFNLPIEDVSQAVYGSLKAFRGDLPQALQASEQALFAVKVGELNAADATKSLTAIVNGFQLQAKDLPLLFDTINQAQNRFGGNTGQMVQGVAKAGGAFRLAGGHYRELIAILQAGSRLTGRTPVEIATAVQRSAGRVLTAQGVEALKKAGLDPQQDYVSLLRQAGALAKGASPERVQELARSLIPQGGQFASTFAPLLQDIARGREGQLGKILPAIAPDQARGSAARELARVLKEPGERIKQITVDLERLGVTLAQLGAGALPGAFLSGLHFVLDTTNDILKVFNAIADIFPFKNAVVGALELAAVLKLVRRFDLGASLPAGKEGGAYSVFREGLRRPEVPRQRAEVLQGLEDEKRFIGSGRERAAQRTAELTVQENLARKRVAELTAQEKIGVATQEQVVEAQAAANNVERQRLAAAELEATYMGEMARVENQILAIRRATIKTMDDLLTATAANGVTYRVPLDRPQAGTPIPLGRPFTQEEAIAAGEWRRNEPSGTALRAAGLRGSIGDKLALLTRLPDGRPLPGVERTQEIASKFTQGPIFRGAAQGVNLLGQSATFLARSAGAAVVGVRRLYESLGAMEKAGIAIFALYQGYKFISDAYHQADSTINDVSSGNLKRVQRAADRQPEDIGDQLPIVGKHGFFGSLGGIWRQSSDLFAKLIPGSQTSDEIANDMKRSAQGEIEAYNNARSKGLYKTQQEIRDKLKAATGRAGGDPGEQMKALDAAIASEATSLANSIYGTKKAREQAKANVAEFRVMQANIQAAAGDMVAAITAITDVKGLQQFQKGIEARLQLGQQTPKAAARSYGYASTRAWELLGSGGLSTEDAAAQISGQDDAQTKALQDEMNRRLALARSPRQQGQIRSDFIGQLREARLGPIRAEMARLESESKQFPDRAKQNNVMIAQLQKGLAFEERQIAGTIAETRRAQFQTRQDAYSTTTDIIVTRLNAAGDPVGALRAKLVRDTNNLIAIRDQYGRQSGEYRKAFKDAMDDQAQVVQGEANRYDSIRDLQTAAATVGASDQVKQQAALSGAVDKLNNARRVGVKGDSLIPYVKAVYDARDAIASQVQSQASDLLDAQRALALSTLDPSDKAAAAVTNLHFDRIALARAQTPAERIRAQAALNNDVRARREGKLANKAATIDYQLSMEQIDKETAAAEYEALARRVRNNKELYRQYKLKAKELTDSANGSGYELDIANIKIPTPYEVTRAIKEGRTGANQYRQHIVDNSRTSIHISVRDANDLAKVGDVLDTHLNTSTRSALRAQGLLN